MILRSARAARGRRSVISAITEKMKRRLFIQGLTKNVSENEIHERFSKFGNVNTVEFKTGNDFGSKNFAYLDLDCDVNNFKKCFAAYNNTTWKGCCIKIEWANENIVQGLEVGSKPVGSCENGTNSVSAFSKNDSHDKIVSPTIPANKDSLQVTSHMQKSHNVYQCRKSLESKQHSVITNMIREGPKPQHITFSSDSESDNQGQQSECKVQKSKNKALKSQYREQKFQYQGQKSECQELNSEYQGQKRKRLLPVLMDSDSDGDTSRPDLSIRPQFVGKKGSNLLELQSHINDSRFVFDVDFCDSCDDEERESTNTKEDSDEEFQKEREKNFRILTDVLGYKPKRKKFSILDMNAVRYWPGEVNGSSRAHNRTS